MAVNTEKKMDTLLVEVLKESKTTIDELEFQVLDYNHANPKQINWAKQYAYTIVYDNCLVLNYGDIGLIAINEDGKIAINADRYWNELIGKKPTLGRFNYWAKNAIREAVTRYDTDINVHKINMDLLFTLNGLGLIPELYTALKNDLLDYSTISIYDIVESNEHLSRTCLEQAGVIIDEDDYVELDGAKTIKPLTAKNYRTIINNFSKVICFNRALLKMEDGVLTYYGLFKSNKEDNIIFDFNRLNKEHTTRPSKKDITISDIEALLN